MKALDNPDFASTGGKQIDEVYVPEDDFALERLLNKIDAEGKATLEEKLKKYADPS